MKYYTYDEAIDYIEDLYCEEITMMQYDNCSDNKIEDFIFDALDETFIFVDHDCYQLRE